MQFQLDAGIFTLQQQRSGNQECRYAGTVSLLGFSCCQRSHLTGHCTRRHVSLASIHPGPGSGQMGKMGGPVCQPPHMCGHHQTEDLGLNCFSHLLRQLTPGKELGCRLAVKKNQVHGAPLPQSAPSDCRCPMRQFVSLLVFNWVLIYVLPMTAPIVEGEWMKQGYMA